MKSLRGLYEDVVVHHSTSSVKISDGKWHVFHKPSTLYVQVVSPLSCKNWRFKPSRQSIARDYIRVFIFFQCHTSLLRCVIHRTNSLTSRTNLRYIGNRKRLFEKNKIKTLLLNSNTTYPHFFTLSHRLFFVKCRVTVSISHRLKYCCVHF